MGRLSVSGLDEFSRQLEALGAAADGIAKHAVYEGAAVGRAAIAAEIRALPEERSRYIRPDSARKLNVVTPEEKADLLDHLGFSRIETANGKTTVSVSFDGYSARTATKKYPRGVPVVLVARSIESGSSVRNKHPFVRNAIRKSSEKIQAAMKDAADEMILKIAGG